MSKIQFTIKSSTAKKASIILGDTLVGVAFGWTASQVLSKLSNKNTSYEETKNLTILSVVAGAMIGSFIGFAKANQIENNDSKVSVLDAIACSAQPLSNCINSIVNNGDHLECDLGGKVSNCLDNYAFYEL